MEVFLHLLLPLMMTVICAQIAAWLVLAGLPVGSRGRRHQGMDSHCSILSPKRLRRGKPVQERWRITIEEHSSNLDILVSVKSAVLRGAAMPIVGWLLKEGQKNILP